MTFNMSTAPSSPKTIGDVAYTLQPTDNNSVLVFNNGSAIALTVPNGLPANFACCIVQEGAGAVTIAGGATVNNRQSQLKTAGQYALVSIVSIAQDNYIVAGDTSS